MEPLDYLRALRRRWAILLAAALVGGAAGWLTAPADASTSSSPSRASGGLYKATQNLMVDREQSTKRSGKNADTTNLPLLAVLATSGELPLRVVERLGLKTTPAAVAGKVEVEADEKLDTLRISSTGSNPEETAAIVDAFAEEILRLAAERNEALRTEALTRAKSIADAQQVRIRHLDARLLQLAPGGSEARLVTAEREALLKVYAEQQGVLQDLQSQPAASPGLVSLGPAVPIPSGTGEMAGGKALQVVGDRRSRAGLGLLLGFALGCALALLVDRIDTRVRSRREAERAFGLPVVAEIPRTRPLSPRVSDQGGTFGVDPATADAYGRLGLAVLHSPRWVLSPRSPTIANDDEEDWPTPVRLVEGPTRLVLVASPGREDARAAVIANLAASLAASGRSVIAIDCDPERRRLADLLGVRGSEHVPARAADPTAKEAAIGRGGVRPSAVRGVWVVTPGASGAGHLADGQFMQSYLEWGDVVLVDAGPILSGGEAGSWAVAADAVLIVTTAGRTSAETAALTHEHLARLQAKVLGVALVHGVARIARGRLRGAPPMPATPPRVSSTGVPAGTSNPSSPPQRRREEPVPSSGSTVRGAPSGQATAQRLQAGEAVGRSDPRRNGGKPASARQSVPARPEPSERIRPVLEVLAPEPSTPAPNPQRRRPRGERTASHEPIWSVSRPWPWATGDQREDPKAGGAPASEPQKSPVESPTEG
ncbi:MAG: hypothetical protein M3252_04595 [Actinomycetota bacterium]|nr:hypothetical protein [Actinomycetota bacterium]